MRKALMLLILFMSQLQLIAQDDVEYRMEFGAGVGMVSYEGDFNGNITHNMQPMASLLWRYNFNPYTGLKVSGSYGKLKGSSADVDTYYPDYQNSPYEFNNTLVDVSTVFEYNFWPYGTGRDYRGARRLTPFVAGGLGVTYVTGGGNNVFTANVPLGVGVKYKVGARLNVGLEWTAHFSLSDKLDGVKDPYYVKSSGLFKNTDCYTALQLTLTYSFMAKCRTCHNRDE
ncbi:MAG: DUF6089 family protein [Prevotella sp.]|nr:DUF6089 family protein [Prevotella sp.]